MHDSTSSTISKHLPTGTSTTRYGWAIWWGPATFMEMTRDRKDCLTCLVSYCFWGYRTTFNDCNPHTKKLSRIAEQKAKVHQPTLRDNGWFGKTHSSPMFQKFWYSEPWSQEWILKSRTCCILLQLSTSSGNLAFRFPWKWRGNIKLCCTLLPFRSNPRGHEFVSVYSSFYRRPISSQVGTQKMPTLPTPKGLNFLGSQAWVSFSLANNSGRPSPSTTIFWSSDTTSWRAWISDGFNEYKEWSSQNFSWLPKSLENQLCWNWQ